LIDSPRSEHAVQDSEEYILDSIDLGIQKRFRLSGIGAAMPNSDPSDSRSMIIPPIPDNSIILSGRFGYSGIRSGQRAETVFFLSRKRKGKPRGITAATDGCVCQSVPTRDSPQETQPMIPAQDRSGLQVFAGTW